VRGSDFSASTPPRGRASMTVAEPQNSHDLLLVLTCFILIFLSRIVLAPLRWGFPFWQEEPIGVARITLARKTREPSANVS